MILLLAVVATAFLACEIARKRYEKTAYFKQTRNPYWRVRRDKGLLGEFYTYRCLRQLPGYKRFLFNCYLPKQDGEKTEIDVIFLHESGIYVFESKNYSGWIFGTETNLYWTQTLPAGRGRAKKVSFLNPIVQNKVHLKWLKAFLQEDFVPFLSYIVFSDRCTLKDIRLTSREHRVVNRYDVLSDIAQTARGLGSQLKPKKIDELYDRLAPLAQAGDSEKRSHIENIHKKHHSPASPSANKVCPRCGGKLVLRTAARGAHAGEQFWGCSHFPRCRYTQNTD